MGGIFVAQIVMILFALAGLAGGALIAWNHAPVVGGEWWPYIRAGAAILGAVIGAKIAAIIGYIVGMAAMFIVGVLW